MKQTLRQHPEGFCHRKRFLNVPWDLLVFASGALVFLVLLAGCGFERDKMASTTPPPATPSSGPPSKTAMSYSQVFAPILKPKCAGCHRGPGAMKGVDVTSFEKMAAMPNLIVPGSPESSVLWRKIDQEKMPPGKPLSAQEKKTIYDWISGGAKNG